jgi:hypothetical protein
MLAVVVADQMCTLVQVVLVAAVMVVVEMEVPQAQILEAAEAEAADLQMVVLVDQEYLLFPMLVAKEELAELLHHQVETLFTHSHQVAHTQLN